MSFLDRARSFFGFEEEDLLEEKDVKPSVGIKSFKGALLNQQGPRYFSASEIKIEEPRVYEDSLNIAANLRESKPCIVNLKYLDPDAGKRLIDFVCGTAYAINGHMMKLGDSIFLFTPEHVQIAESGEDKTVLQQGVEQEEKHVFFNQTAIG